jgi:cell wall-associated NlpC family hydrolase
MADQQVSKSVLSRGLMVVSAATKFAARTATTPYILGGKTDKGYDCSWFVYVALHSVFPEYKYLSSGAIATSGMFEEVKAPEPGDVIYFPPGANPYEVQKCNDNTRYPGHVAIVVDKDTFIGRQSISLGVVPINQVWWGARSHRYLRYRGLKANDQIMLAHASSTSGG